MIIVGSLHRLTYSVIDENKAPVNATTVALTITRPDGTTVVPTVTNPPATTGTYVYDYAPTQVGRHVVSWATTFPTTTGSDVFNVDSAATGVQLVGLGEAKAALNMTRTTNDDELRRVIVSASQLVEAETQLWHRATVVEQFTPARVLFLSSLPIVSITSVVQAGVTAAVNSYAVAPSGGMLVATNGGRPWVWPYPGTGSGVITVTYEAGASYVPAIVREAALDTVQDIWESQRGAASQSILSLSSGEDVSRVMTYALPYRARKKLEPWLKLAGIA